MKILGIHDGHNASAALVVDGELKYAASEERYSRLKHHYGFPKNAINKILSITKLEIDDIDAIAMSTKTLPPKYFYTRRNSTFTIKDYLREQSQYWYPKIYKNENPKYLDIFKDKINLKYFPYDQSLINDEDDYEGMWNARKVHLLKTFKIDSKKIHVFDHHNCHAAYGWGTNPLNNLQDSLILTVDGGGDNCNASVSIAKKNKSLEEISRSSNCNIGRMYRYATLILGMRPADHEYKLMGLAAYNSEKYGQNAYQIYADTLINDGLKFSYKNLIKDNFFYFKNKLDGERFDAIAFGIQKRTEELLVNWVKNAVSHTGIRNIVITGGVAQNIKANQLILDEPEVNSLFVPPGPGDESISIGAAFLASYKISNSKLFPKSISNGYFFPNSELITKDKLLRIVPDNWEIKKVNKKDVALLLSKGQIVARFSSDKVEFGARALGGRSIIADPRNPRVIHRINKLIKMRDFWMPFAPSILESRKKDYLVFKKDVDASYMSIGFRTKLIAVKDIPAGIHPFDHTARPQVVKKSENPEYFELIKEFEKITGVGAVMNTSFNIHGDAIVLTPEDAIDTLKRSGLDYLYIDDYLVKKN